MFASGDGDSAPPTQDDKSKKQKTGVGVAAAASVNLIKQTTQASIIDAGPIQAGSLSVTADNKNDIIAAPGGLNMRQTPSTSGAIVTYLAGGQVVDVIAGPSEGDGYIWWQLDDRNGNQGWTAEGDGETAWLSPSLGEPQPVNRAPRVGDRVVVTTEQGQQLSIRAQPGPDAPLLTRINQGAQVTILAGPQSAGGFTWYQIRSDDGSVEGWAADGDSTRRWLSPLE